MMFINAAYKEETKRKKIIIGNKNDFNIFKVEEVSLSDKDIISLFQIYIKFVLYTIEIAIISINTMIVCEILLFTFIRIYNCRKFQLADINLSNLQLDIVLILWVVIFHITVYNKLIHNEQYTILNDIIYIIYYISTGFILFRYVVSIYGLHIFDKYLNTMKKRYPIVLESFVVKYIIDLVIFIIARMLMILIFTILIIMLIFQQYRNESLIKIRNSLLESLNRIQNIVHNNKEEKLHKIQEEEWYNLEEPEALQKKPNELSYIEYHIYKKGDKYGFQIYAAHIPRSAILWISKVSDNYQAIIEYTNESKKYTNEDNDETKEFAEYRKKNPQDPCDDIDQPYLQDTYTYIKKIFAGATDRKFPLNFKDLKSEACFQMLDLINVGWSKKDSQKDNIQYKSFSHLFNYYFSENGQKASKLMGLIK